MVVLRRRTPSQTTLIAGDHIEIVRSIPKHTSAYHSIDGESTDSYPPPNEPIVVNETYPDPLLNDRSRRTLLRYPELNSQAIDAS